MTDAEQAAHDYDDAHGGPVRARDAAAALDALLDEHLGQDRRVLDLAAGPGSVARHLSGTVVALDHAPAFTTAAAGHLPGRVVRADAENDLPLGPRTVDAVITVWWLHMTAGPDRFVDEHARPRARLPSPHGPERAQPCGSNRYPRPGSVTR
ncbi:class I SAM-dependent methyltransferase [Actinomycetospora endophytica]|uniref:Class I SAM-dependent methyltransferase n=1 Tax=Actinomycetospora endophytica TaxID=2291215 RepID=A0ABS8PB31_9PSEU|nr:class I SAM-dependent methyltransferase [Actinomycetospora endophytica]MCD2195466.1 class I SAM-dependent methyltransferase [Actinomycetospora endophytica]